MPLWTAESRGARAASGSWHTCTTMFWAGHGADGIAVDNSGRNTLNFSNTTKGERLELAGVPHPDTQGTPGLLVVRIGGNSESVLLGLDHCRATDASVTSSWCLTRRPPSSKRDSDSSKTRWRPLIVSACAKTNTHPRMSDGMFQPPDTLQKTSQLVPRTHEEFVTALPVQTRAFFSARDILSDGDKNPTGQSVCLTEINLGKQPSSPQLSSKQSAPPVINRLTAPTSASKRMYRRGRLDGDGLTAARRGGDSLPALSKATSRPGSCRLGPPPKQPRAIEIRFSRTPRH